MRAFNSLNRIGASSLSNEIASGASFRRRRNWLAAGGDEETAGRAAQPLAGRDDGAGYYLRLDDGAGV